MYKLDVMSHEEMYELYATFTEGNKKDALLAYNKMNVDFKKQFWDFLRRQIGGIDLIYYIFVNCTTV